MKKTVLLFILIYGITYSQNTHRFFYELKFKKDSLSEQYDKDFYVLDVSKGEQKFYNYEYYQNDSISKSKVNSEHIFTYPKLDIRLIHKEGNDFENYESQAPLYYLIKTTDKLDWQILPDRKKYENFNVQKAVTKFGGRVWEAWFTTEIPFQYGPYKFYNLPGLILEISDTKGNYIFSFRGNKNISGSTDTSQFLETQAGMKPTEIPEKQWQKLKLNYFLNPLQGYGEGGLLVENDKGEIVQADSRKIIEGQQNYLRRYNNPIELDKAVKYPDK